MAVPDTKGFRVKKGNETGISKIATEAILDKAVTKAKLAQAVQDELDHKADQDGDYDSLTAGGAKQLLSAVYVDDNEPYNFRTAGGSANIGDRMYEEVVGGTVVWNQKAFPETHYSVTGGDVFMSGGVATWLPSGKDQQVFKQINSTRDGLAVGKVYFLRLSYKTSTATTDIVPRVFQRDYPTTATTDWQDFTLVLKSKIDTVATIGVKDMRSADWDSIQTKDLMVCDLTQMFGSTIADYIYSLEQGTAGAGVAWFRNLFPKPYYEYNAGELMSVKAGSHDTVGFNAWDEETELGIISTTTGENTASTTQLRSKNYIPVVPNSTYYVNVANTSSLWIAVLTYDANKNFISNLGGKNSGATFTTPSNCSFVRFYVAGDYGKTYKNDICIHLAWDGERNGEYEPYEKHSYPLAELELRGIPKLDANNQLCYDGDTYESDGTVTRRYGVVDLGTLNWSYDTSGSQNTFYAAFNLINKTGYTNASLFPILCPRYISVVYYSGGTYMGGIDKAIAYGPGAGSRFYVTDSNYTDAATFKAAMSGVMLVYELAEPTTETAAEYVNPQVVDDFGTEEYVDYAVEAGDRDVAIPVGHNSQYMNNLRAKLEIAPESPDGDGKYIVQQSNGENAYIPYTADGRLDALEAKVPAPPSANGTYKLTATVTDGGVTYTWVAG